MLPLLQAATAATHPLDPTAARWLWAVPLLPFLGFLINGALSIGAAYHPGPGDPALAHGDSHDASAAHDQASHGDTADDHHAVKRHRFAGLTSIVGSGVLVLAFALSVAIYVAMLSAGGGAMEHPFIQRYFSWMPVGDLHIDAAFQLDQPRHDGHEGRALPGYVHESRCIPHRVDKVDHKEHHEAGTGRGKECENNAFHGYLLRLFLDRVSTNRALSY